MWDAELDSAHLHVTRGAVLIERQRAMIDELRAHGYSELADRSEEILHELLLIQAERVVMFHKLMAKRRAHV